MATDWNYEFLKISKAQSIKVKISGDGRLKACIRTTSSYNKGALEGDEELELEIIEEDFGEEHSIYLDVFGEEGAKIEIIG